MAYDGPIRAPGHHQVEHPCGPADAIGKRAAQDRLGINHYR
jgi:hypothetical protein